MRGVWPTGSHPPPLHCRAHRDAAHGARRSGLRLPRRCRAGRGTARHPVPVAHVRRCPCQRNRAGSPTLHPRAGPRQRSCHEPANSNSPSRRHDSEHREEPAPPRPGRQVLRDLGFRPLRAARPPLLPPSFKLPRSARVSMNCGVEHLTRTDLPSAPGCMDGSPFSNPFRMCGLWFRVHHLVRDIAAARCSTCHRSIGHLPTPAGSSVTSYGSIRNKRSSPIAGRSGAPSARAITAARPRHQAATAHIPAGAGVRWTRCSHHPP